MNRLEECKDNNVQAMIKLSISKLDDLKKYYSRLGCWCREEFYKESAAINSEKWMQVNEAIAVK